MSFGISYFCSRPLLLTGTANPELLRTDRPVKPAGGEAMVGTPPTSRLSWTSRSTRAMVCRTKLNASRLKPQTRAARPNCKAQFHPLGEPFINYPIPAPS